MIFSNNSVVLGGGSSTSGVTRISGVELDPQTYSYSSITDQWVQSATASSQYSSTSYKADNLIGTPRPNVSAGDSPINSSTIRFVADNGCILNELISCWLYSYIHSLLFYYNCRFLNCLL
jgi:hypothetical protein